MYLSLIFHKLLNAILGLRGLKKIGKKCPHVNIEQFIHKGFTPLGWKDIGMIKSKFVAKTQFLFLFPKA